MAADWIPCRPQDLEPYVGCNSLKYVLFTGNNVAFSPLRISGKALAVGSLQKLRLESFHGFSDLQGPRISLADRMQPIVFSRKPFNVGIVALSPPLLLQTRANSSATSTSGGHVPDNSCSEARSTPVACLSGRARGRGGGVVIEFLPPPQSRGSGDSEKRTCQGCSCSFGEVAPAPGPR